MGIEALADDLGEHRLVVGFLEIGDSPGGGGKIPLLPEYVEGREGGDLLLRNYEGKVFRYPDCPSAEGVIH